MDANGLPLVGDVDYTKVGAIHHKRTIAFINYFIGHTVSFLNKFARSCEQRLAIFDSRIQKIDASLSILEAKLSSISTLENVTKSEVSCDLESTVVPEESSNVQVSEPLPDVKAEEVPPASNVQDPKFARFFRMVQVGVPIEAVKQKMRAEGLDPSALDDPNSMEHTADGSETDSSFSD